MPSKGTKKTKAARSKTESKSKKALGRKYIPKDNATNLEVMINELEERRNSKVLPLLLGETSIDRLTVTDVYNDVKLLIRKPIDQLDVIVDSAGGNIDAAYHLVKLLRRCAKRIVMIVPRFAKSAATLLVCGGHEIVMGPPSELGPLDPQIRVVRPAPLEEEIFSPLSIQNTLDLLSDLIKDDKEKLAEILTSRLLPLSVGAYLRSIDIARKYLINLLQNGMFNGETLDEGVLEAIGEKLTKGYPHHGYCIDAEEAKDIGLKINCEDDDWDAIWNIYMHFEEHGRNQRRKEMEELLRKLITTTGLRPDSTGLSRKLIREMIETQMEKETNEPEEVS